MEEKIVSSYEEAVSHVEASYWVEPIIFAPTCEHTSQAWFWSRYRISDESDSGLVHYSKKQGAVVNQVLALSMAKAGL